MLCVLVHEAYADTTRSQWWRLSSYSFHSVLDVGLKKERNSKAGIQALPNDLAAGYSFQLFDPKEIISKHLVRYQDLKFCIASMDPTNQVLVFGDQAVAVSVSFSKLYALSKRSFLLARFLQLASETVKAAAEQYVLASESFLFKPSLLELCELQGQGESRNIAISTVLSCINQLGWLMLEASEDGGILRSAGDNTMLAACTGSVAAIAAACVTSVTDLLTISPEVISIAVRLGLEALRRSNNIEPSNDNWTIAALNVSLNPIQSMLDVFHQSQVRDYKAIEKTIANSGYSLYPCIGGPMLADPHRLL